MGNSVRSVQVTRPRNFPAGSRIRRIRRRPSNSSFDRLATAQSRTNSLSLWLIFGASMRAGRSETSKKVTALGSPRLDAITVDLKDPVNQMARQAWRMTSGILFMALRACDERDY